MKGGDGVVVYVNDVKQKELRFASDPQMLINSCVEICDTVESEQKMIKEDIKKKISLDAIVQDMGKDESKIMSQAAVNHFIGINKTNVICSGNSYRLSGTGLYLVLPLSGGSAIYVEGINCIDYGALLSAGGTNHWQIYCLNGTNHQTIKDRSLLLERAEGSFILYKFI